MPKKGYTSYSDEKYHSAFATIMREELVPTAEEAKELAEYLGISVQAVNQYKQGQGFPKTENLVKIAHHYNRSLDNLIGLSSVKTPNAEVQAICDYTKLSEISLYNLVQMVNGDYPGDDGNAAVINALLSSPNDLHSLIVYIRTLKEACDALQEDLKDVHEFQEKGEMGYYGYTCKRNLQLDFFEADEAFRNTMSAIFGYQNIIETIERLERSFIDGDNK